RPLGQRVNERLSRSGNRCTGPSNVPGRRPTRSGPNPPAARQKIGRGSCTRAHRPEAEAGGVESPERHPVPATVDGRRTASNFLPFAGLRTGWHRLESRWQALVFWTRYSLGTDPWSRPTEIADHRFRAPLSPIETRSAASSRPMQRTPEPP